MNWRTIIVPEKRPNREAKAGLLVSIRISFRSSFKDVEDGDEDEDEVEAEGDNILLRTLLAIAKRLCKA